MEGNLTSVNYTAEPSSVNLSTTPFPDYINIDNLTFGEADVGLSVLEHNGSYSECVEISGGNASACWDIANYTNGSFYGEEIPKSYWAFILLIFPFFTVFGNCLVCIAVYRERSLQTATNFFIVSLAIADIAVGILVMPLAVYVEVSFYFF